MVWKKQLKMKNYYQILQLDYTTEIIEIKKAYRKLALKFHPDKNKSPNAQDIFIKITEAYEILSNYESKKEYDVLYKKFFIKNEKLTEESINSFSDWEKKSSKKAEEYMNTKYSDFTEILNEFTFHASNYGKIGCIGGVFYFLGIVWIIGPFFIIANSNSKDIFFPVVISFVMGIGALIIGNNEVKKMKNNYRIEKNKFKK